MKPGKPIRAFDAVASHVRSQSQRSSLPETSEVESPIRRRARDLDVADLAAIVLAHPHLELPEVEQIARSFARGPVTKLHDLESQASPELALAALSQTLQSLPPPERARFLRGEGVDLLRVALQDGKPWQDVVQTVREQVQTEVRLQPEFLSAKKDLARLMARVGAAAAQDVQVYRDRLESWARHLEVLRKRSLGQHLKSFASGIANDPMLPLLVGAAGALATYLGGDAADATMWAAVMAMGMKAMDFALDDEVAGIIPNVQRLIHPAWEGTVLAGATNLPEGGVGTSLARNPSVGTAEAMGVSLNSNAANVLLWGLATVTAFPKMVGAYRDQAEAIGRSRPSSRQAATEVFFHLIQSGGDKLAWAAGFTGLAMTFLNAPMAGAELVVWGAAAAVSVGVYVSTNLLGTQASADAAVRDLEPEQVARFRELWKAHTDGEEVEEVDTLFDAIEARMAASQLDPRHPPSERFRRSIGQFWKRLLAKFTGRQTEATPLDRLVDAVRSVVQKSQDDPDLKARFATLEAHIPHQPSDAQACTRQMVKILETLGVEGFAGGSFDPWTAAKLVPGAGMMVGAATVITTGATGLGPAVGLPLMLISGLLAFMSSWPEFSTMKILIGEGQVRKSIDVASGSNAINLLLALSVLGMRGGKL